MMHLLIEDLHRSHEGMRILLAWRLLLFVIYFALSAHRLHAVDELPDGWPKLPLENGVVRIPAQEWTYRPAPRHVKVFIYYPAGRLENVNPATGLMLTLHNWGGTEATGSADPKVLTERLDVISIAVDFLQSGKFDGADPYDFGYFQALDSLRALWYVQQGLKSTHTPFDGGRIYATGGSTGAHVALMCDKFAPRTFACIVDLSGMSKLNDDIAFGLPGGSTINARWQKAAGHPNSLSIDDREIREIGNASHLAEMNRLGHTAKIIVVHGVDDTMSPFAETKEMVEAMKSAKLDVEPHFIGRRQLDGKVFRDIGHTLGQRIDILFHVAEKYLRRGSTNLLERKTPTDFDRREDIKFKTTNGLYTISYDSGFPVARFDPKNLNR